MRARNVARGKHSSDSLSLSSKMPPLPPSKAKSKNIPSKHGKDRSSDSSSESISSNEEGYWIVIYVSATQKVIGSPSDDKLFVQLSMDDSDTENVSKNSDAPFVFSGYFFIVMSVVALLIIGVVILLMKRIKTTRSSPLLAVKQHDYHIFSIRCLALGEIR
jgi:hypothetical protein